MLGKVFSSISKISGLASLTYSLFKFKQQFSDKPKETPKLTIASIISLVLTVFIILPVSWIVINCLALAYLSQSYNLTLFVSLLYISAVNLILLMIGIITIILLSRTAIKKGKVTLLSVLMKFL